MTFTSNTEAAELEAANSGVMITPDDLRSIEALQAAELARVRASVQQQDETPGLIAAFNRNFPRLLAGLHAIGDTALAIFRTAIVAGGVPIILMLLLIVEIGRVSLGVGLFETDTAIATFAATSIVLLNLTVELVIDYQETRAGYHEDRALRWSLRLFARNLAYRLGIGEHWIASELSPAHRYRRLRSIVTFSILTLALAGSMRSAIASTGGTWYEALGAILTKSTLAEASVWLSGIIFAVAAVLSAQSLTRYVSERVAEVLLTMTHHVDQAEVNEAAALDRIAAQYITAKVRMVEIERSEKERARQERLAAKQPKPAQIPPDDIEMIIRPTQALNGRMNGNGNGHHE